MEKTKNILGKIKDWSLWKKILAVLVLLLVAWLVVRSFLPENLSDKAVTDTIKRVDLQKTILATGQVTSDTNLDLSFIGSGVVNSVRVKVGDKVSRGQVLATLEQRNESAAYTQAEANLVSAKARYDRLIAGATNEEIRLAEVALNNAKLDYERVVAQQEVLVSNTYKNLLNSTPEATLVSGPSSTTAPTISGTYKLNEEGEIRIYTYSSGSGMRYDVSGIVQGGGQVDTANPQPVGDSGLYILFSSTNSSNVGGWVIKIPNTKASDYLTNLNAYNSALKTRDTAVGTAQSLVDQREAELALKKAGATVPNIDIAKADIMLAEGQLQNALANLEHKILRAPVNGTITRVDIKPGELTQALSRAMTLEDVDNLYLEANINEANITDVRIGSKVFITFDAFGEEDVYFGKITKIDPSSTLVSGVVNYKITASVDNVPSLRPGMTANMTILVDEKPGVLVIPQRSIVSENGISSVRVVTDPRTKNFELQEVKTGLLGDGGMMELVSGLAEGTEIITFLEK